MKALQSKTKSHNNNAYISMNMKVIVFGLLFVDISETNKNKNMFWIIKKLEDKYKCIWSKFFF